MTSRFGLGPVFAYEWLMQSRRWQIYAIRSVFGLSLLATLAFIWFSGDRPVGSPTLQAYAQLGQTFFVGLTGTQITLVLLVAPAATAGAVCLDRQRGSLTHLLVTDLSDAEIILGKLAARLVPVLYLLMASLPIVALSMLLGGIDPVALMGAMLISLGLAVLGCALALTISVWAGKTHEVLLATYTILGLWLMILPISGGLGFVGRRGRWSFPDWLEWSNPYLLAFQPYLVPGSRNLAGGAIFLAGCLAISAILTGASIARLRPVAANPRTPRVRKVRADVAPRRRWTDLLPGPSLDGNPVLWREWHRARPSRISGLAWAIYLGIYGTFAVLAILPPLNGRSFDEVLAVFTNGFGATTGLILVSVMAATSLAEERVRGSLDVLMSTPLPTRSIVWGKWWGAVRNGIPPAIPMLVVASGLAVRSSQWLAVLLLLGYYAGLVSMIASIGLLAATFLRQPGRALAVTVTVYLSLAVGLFFAVLASTHASDDSFIGHGSPFFAFVITTASCAKTHHRGEWATYYAVPFWIFVWFAYAAALLAITVFTFDRRLGRVPETPREARFARSAIEPRAKPSIALE